jgi:Phosphotransferase enzyme family
MTWEHYAAVPGSDGATLLVVDGRLPSLALQSWRTPEFRTAIAPLIGTPVYLRLAAHARVGADDYLRLHVFDAGDRGERLPLADADPERLAPPSLRPALARWLAEQQGAAVPPERPAWSRPGWHAEAEAWVGCALQPVRIWPLSAVLRGELAGGPVYLKAVFTVFHHEPAVTQALAREHPGLVPDVLRIDTDRGWLLMSELTGSPGFECDSAGPALQALETIQAAWSGRADELLALGAQDRRLSTLEASIAELVDTAAPELAAAVPPLVEACHLLASRGVPETIGHGDFHQGNVVVAGGRAVIFDWSDACVTHPSFDRHRFHFDPAQPSSYEDPVAAALECLHQAVSYRAIVAALEPDDRWWFADEPRLWLERAAQLVR